MIQHVHDCARACSEISEVWVVTDDERILRCVQGFGGRAVMTRKDHASGTDRIAEAVEALKLQGDDLVVNIQGDQPLFQPSLISNLIEPLLGDPQLPMCTLQYRITEQGEPTNPNNVKVVTDKDGYALYFSRSQIPFFRDATAGRTYYKHLGFYGYRPAFLKIFASLPVGRLESTEKLEQLRALENGFRIRVVDSSSDSLGVDSPADIKKVEAMMARSS